MNLLCLQTHALCYYHSVKPNLHEQVFLDKFSLTRKTCSCRRQKHRQFFLVKENLICKLDVQLSVHSAIEPRYRVVVKEGGNSRILVLNDCPLPLQLSVLPIDFEGQFSSLSCNGYCYGNLLTNVALWKFS